MNNDVLEGISTINKHRKEGKYKIKERSQSFDCIPGKVSIITGIRRSGKSYKIYQKINELIDSGVNPYNILYINFFGSYFLEYLHLDGIKKIWEIYQQEVQLNKANKEQKIYIFLDEIQEVENRWRFVLDIVEFHKDIYITISGSNANLLSKEFGTYLVGRYTKFVNYPLDFAEFLTWKGFENNKLNKATNNVLFKKIKKEYLLTGGFPEVILNDLIDPKQYIRELTQDIIYKDIIKRHPIDNVKILEELCHFIFSNIGNLHSYNNLGKHFTIHDMTIKQYISYLSDAYLVDTIKKFSFSLKKQSKSQFKLYTIDNIFGNIGMRLDSDYGKMLENLVYVYLKKKFDSVFYYSGDEGDVDFVTKKNNELYFYQICYSIDTQKTFEREIKTLVKIHNKNNKENIKINLYLIIDNINKIFEVPEYIQIVKWDELYSQKIKE